MIFLFYLFVYIYGSKNSLIFTNHNVVPCLEQNFRNTAILKFTPNLTDYRRSISCHSDTLSQEYIFCLVGSRLRENIAVAPRCYRLSRLETASTKADKPVKPKCRFINNLPHYSISVLAAQWGPLFPSLVWEKA
jgi:hypothetical protein